MSVFSREARSSKGYLRAIMYFKLLEFFSVRVLLQLYVIRNWDFREFVTGKFGRVDYFPLLGLIPQRVGIGLSGLNLFLKYYFLLAVRCNERYTR